MKLDKHIVETYATEPNYSGSQAKVGRALRAAGYRFANMSYRKMWDDVHGVSTANEGAEQGYADHTA